MDWVQKVAQIPVNGTDDTPEVCIIEVDEVFNDFFINLWIFLIVRRYNWRY